MYSFLRENAHLWTFWVFCMGLILKSGDWQWHFLFSRVDCLFGLYIRTPFFDISILFLFRYSTPKELYIQHNFFNFWAYMFQFELLLHTNYFSCAVSSMKIKLIFKFYVFVDNPTKCHSRYSTQTKVLVSFKTCIVFRV